MLLIQGFKLCFSKQTVQEVISCLWPLVEYMRVDSQLNQQQHPTFTAETTRAPPMSQFMCMVCNSCNDLTSAPAVLYN